MQQHVQAATCPRGEVLHNVWDVGKNTETNSTHLSDHIPIKAVNVDV